MESRKFIKVIVPTTLLGLFIFSVPSASAYGIETHAYLTQEVINFYNQNYSDRKIPDELRSYLIDGSRKEDETPRWLNHFYDPVYDRGLSTAYGIKGYRSKTWAQDASKQNEVRFKVSHFIASLLTAAEQKKIGEISADADFTWNRAIQFYINGEPEKAMFALGHVIHLIEDLGVPDHTRNDDHANGSPYENFAKRFNSNSSDPGLSSRLSGKSPVSLNNLEAHFNSLASYSNNNFYSKDTIGIQSGYNLPQPTDYEIQGDLRFARSQDEGSFYKLFAQSAGASFLVDFQGEVTVDDEAVMIDYWNHLSPKVVQHGAGIVDLFFQEAEKAKDDPRFAKKEKKNFLTQAIDAAKDAFSNIFDKTGNKPVAVIDVNQQNQQQPVNNPSTPTVSVDKTTVNQGETLVESGQGFSPNSDVLMHFELPNRQIVNASIKTDSQGSYRKSYVMPRNALTGQYTYYAKDLGTGVLSNKVNYTVKTTVVVARERQDTQEVKKQDKKEPVQKKKTEQAIKQQIKECGFNTSQSPSHHEIIINEVAWMGGPSSAGLGASDEWIELKNLTNKSINVSGWQIISQDEDIKIILKDGASIPAGGFYLLERTNDDSVPGVSTDHIYTGALSNSNEGLRLFASDCSLIDEVTAKPNWPAGDSASRRTMQRNTDLNWSTFGGEAAGGIFGTPKRENGVAWNLSQVSSGGGSSSAGGGSTSGSGGSSANSSGSSSQNSSQPSSTKILISEVQITGGTGKTNFDFIELFNPNSAEFNLNGYRLVKRTKTGTSDASIKSWTTNAIVPAEGYYLWANSGYADISVIPDVTTSATISNDNGVAVRFGAEDTGMIIDSVGWGGAANAFVEGTVFGTNPEANQSIQRKTGSGFLDTDNNANDFELQDCPNPKTQSSTCQSVASNQAPTASFSFSPQSPTTGSAISLDAASSSDPDGQITSYSWDFGDSALASSTSATTTHSYSSVGNYEVSLIVFDNQNASSTAASSTITVTDPAPSPSILFQQSDSSSGVLLAGGQFFPLGNGADGSANQLKIRFKPDNVVANNQFYAAPWRIRENGGLELDFWYSSNDPKADQPKYCFTTAETDAWKDIVFTFASGFNFLSSKTYDVYLLFLRDQNERVCIHEENTGTGNLSQGTWATNASSIKIYFQIGNGL